MAGIGPSYNFGPAIYQMSDGQHCRNLLGNPIHQAMSLFARGQPNLEGPQANFWFSELQTDLRQEDGYQIGAEFNTAERPGRDGTYHRTDRVVWRVDTNHMTLTMDIILEAKASDSMSKPEHLEQTLRDAEEITRTYGYQWLHVITTRGTTFHAWVYDSEAHELESLFSEQHRDQHLDACITQASEEWFHFIHSVKTRPNMKEVHPSQVLPSQAT